MSNPSTAKSTATQSKNRITALSALAWMALLYTWTLGHIEPLTHWLSHLPGPDAPDAFGSPLWCLFKSFFHLPCLFCGLTRSFILIGQGKLTESWHYHPLGLPVYCFTVAFALIGLIKPLWGEAVFRFLTRRPLLILIFCVFSLGWLWKILHSPHFW